MWNYNSNNKITKAFLFLWFIIDQCPLLYSVRLGSFLSLFSFLSFFSTSFTVTCITEPLINNIVNLTVRWVCNDIIARTKTFTEISLWFKKVYINCVLKEYIYINYISVCYSRTYSFNLDSQSRQFPGFFFKIPRCSSLWLECLTLKIDTVLTTPTYQISKLPWKLSSLRLWNAWSVNVLLS